MIKRGLTLDNALNITPRTSINDAADPEAGCTTARVRMPAEYRFRGVVPDAGAGCRPALEAGSTNRLHFGSTSRLHFGSRNRLHFGSRNRLHFGSRNRLHVAGHGPRRTAVVAVTNGRRDFGTWERISYGELDGRQRKRVLVKSRRHAVPARCFFGIIGE
jgi:hypothetical protein